MFLFFFFFFQAEDGIRDLTVTGVQTCALPISPALVVAEHGPRIARADAGLLVVPHVDVEAQRALGLNEDTARDALAEVVVAIVALEQECGPTYLAGAQPPIFHGRDIVEGAELDPVSGGLARAQLGA